MTDKEKWNLQIAKHEKVIWNKNGPLRFHGPFGPAQLKKKKLLEESTLPGKMKDTESPDSKYICYAIADLS